MQTASEADAAQRCTRQNRTIRHRVPSLAIHPMAECIEEAIATVTLKEHYSFDPLGPGGRLVGSGDLCGGKCPFPPRARSRGPPWSRRVLHTPLDQSPISVAEAR